MKYKLDPYMFKISELITCINTYYEKQNIEFTNDIAVKRLQDMYAISSLDNRYYLQSLLMLAIICEKIVNENIAYITFIISKNKATVELTHSSNDDRLYTEDITYQTFKEFHNLIYTLNNILNISNNLMLNDNVKKSLIKTTENIIDVLKLNSLNLYVFRLDYEVNILFSKIYNFIIHLISSTCIINGGDYYEL